MSAAPRTLPAFADAVAARRPDTEAVVFVDARAGYATLLDPRTARPVAAGVPGKRVFRGVSRLLGYHNDPEHTRAVIDADGWFHTGDLMTLDADGPLGFAGRLKDMLTVGGENVAAAEVEGVLAGHPAVAVVAVVGAPDARSVEVVAAFAELRPGARAAEQELIEFCLPRLASFKVPRHVRPVTEWPMSGTKIRKDELRRRIAAELAERGIREAPRTPSARAAAQP